MATFEEVVAQDGARFQTPTFRENGRYAYGTMNGTTYTYFTPRDEQYDDEEMRTNAAFCCNCIALDMNLPELKTKKSCFLTSFKRECTIPPQYPTETSTRVVNNNTIAIPVKPLLLRIKNDVKYSSQCPEIKVIPCKSTNVDYYFAKDVEFEVIKYIDVRKHSTTNTTVNNALNNIDDEVLSLAKFALIYALLPDTDSHGETYDDLITVYDNFSIKFDYLIFTKEHNNAKSAMHIISAYNMTTISGPATNLYKGTLGTFEYDSFGSRLTQIDELLYGNLPGAIIAHIDSTSEGDAVGDITVGAMHYSNIISSVSRTNYAEYTTHHKSWPGAELVETNSIDTAVNTALRTVNRSNKGILFNCAMSMKLDIGYSDEYERAIASDYITSTIHIDLVHSDIISTDYLSKIASGATDTDYSLFLVHALYSTDAENFIDVISRVFITALNEYRFDPAVLIDVIYNLKNDPKHFQFEKTTRSSGQTKAVSHNYTGDDIEDTINFIESNPSLQYTDSTPFITPMEYYARGKTNFEFDDKVENILSTEEEPNYFWIETLKNWGYFAINGQLTKDANIVVDLLLWNGSGQWVDATAILDNVKKKFIPKRLYQHYIERIKQLAPHGRPTGSDEYDELNKTINDMIAMIFARNSTIPFKFENLTTVDIERSYHNSTANYAGKSSKSWWEYIPLVYTAKSIWSGVKAAWNFSPAGMFYNAVWGDGVWEGIKSGYKDLFDCVYNLYGVANAVDLIELGVELLFTDNSDPFVSKLDPYQHLMSIARYIVLPYDEKYSNNDATTLQTIRPDLIRYTNLEGGIINRESIIEYSVIPNVIGSPFVARSSTGELMIAYRMCYSGPVKEDADSSHDLIKMSGIIEKDVEFSNKLLQDKLGKGIDKTAIDMFNTYGKLPSTDLKSSATVKLPETTETAGVDRLTNQVQTTFGSVTLKTNRSKTSSDLDTAEINTLTKW